MNRRIIDCCSLLNLYTGWGGLTELRDLGLSWHICEAVLNEVEYTREYSLGGAPVMIPLDIHELNRSAVLLPVRPDTAAEIEDYVDLATEIDDGEAQALAIAKHRGFVLLTDDRKAAKVACRPDVSVRTISTAEILRSWAQLDPANEARLYDVVSRVEILARFAPRMDSPEYTWWKGYLQR